MTQKMTQLSISSECQRLAGQLLHAFEGKAWHGPAWKELLAGLSDREAEAHPVAGAHSIWELALHVEFWGQATLETIHGTPMPQHPVPIERDFPKPAGGTSAWQKDMERLFDLHQRLHGAMSSVEDQRLTHIVPGRKYSFYFLFSGITQHALYHAGQVALLKRALKAG